MGSKNLPAMAIGIVEEKVSTFIFTSRLPGPLAGARAEISDPARARRVKGMVTTTVPPR
jgi:hypothetical protein